MRAGRCGQRSGGGLTRGPPELSAARSWRGTACACAGRVLQALSRQRRSVLPAKGTHSALSGFDLAQHNFHHSPPLTPLTRPPTRPPARHPALGRPSRCRRPVLLLPVESPRCVRRPLLPFALPPTRPAHKLAAPVIALHRHVAVLASPGAQPHGRPQRVLLTIAAAAAIRAGPPPTHVPTLGRRRLGVSHPAVGEPLDDLVPLEADQVIHAGDEVVGGEAGLVVHPLQRVTLVTPHARLAEGLPVGHPGRQAGVELFLREAARSRSGLGRQGRPPRPNLLQRRLTWSSWRWAALWRCGWRRLWWAVRQN